MHCVFGIQEAWNGIHSVIAANKISSSMDGASTNAKDVTGQVEHDLDNLLERAKTLFNEIEKAREKLAA